jgi:hypothetical protein
MARLHRYYEWGLILWQRFGGLLVFCPEPCRDGFFDVGQRFLFRLSLREAAGESRAFRHDPAFLVFFQDHVKHHGELQHGAMRFHIYTLIGAKTVQVYDAPARPGDATKVHFSWAAHLD